MNLGFSRFPAQVELSKDILDARDKVVGTDFSAAVPRISCLFSCFKVHFSDFLLELVLDSRQDSAGPAPAS